MARRACLAMGVSWVTPPRDANARFALLDGAVVAAREIGEWALRSGFGEANVRVVDDEQVEGKENPVTKERVQRAVDELFPSGAEVVEHLILAFCGHGLTDANFNSISWLFSDSLRARYRVIAETFIEELLLHGVQRITLITDACREAPNSLDLLRLQAERGITVESSRRVESPRFDRFAACQDGQRGYMVSDPALAAMAGKCVFSGVIADVLWGEEQAAIKDGVITTTTFGACVRARTSERARDYRLKLNPQCLVDPEAAVLFDAARPPTPPRQRQPWPPAGAARTTTGPGASDSTEISLSRGGLETFGTDESARVPSDAEASAAAREQAADEVGRSLGQVVHSERPGGPNLIVLGNWAKLWTRGPATPGTPTAGRFEFRVGNDRAGTPLLVELADGSFTPVVPYEGLALVVKPSTAGGVYQAYSRQDSGEDFGRAFSAIADFAAGRIGPDRIDELAGLLRYAKHTDPVLGAICAYLYRAIADFDSIRRMAYFYIQHGQPVPFDIALLGAMKVTREPDGALLLHVPAVKARRSGQGAPDVPNYVTQATPAREAMIGGRCPWLGLGWDYVSLPRPESAELVHGLAEFAPEVRRSAFTVLPNTVGRALAAAWQLEPR